MANIPRIDQPISEVDIPLEKETRHVTTMITRQWYNYLSVLSSMKITSGDGAPTTPPLSLGDEYLDLTNKKMYKAFGITALSDWVILN